MKKNIAINDLQNNFRQMPQAIEAEESLLSSCLLGDAVQIVERLTSDDFYKNSHKLIFCAVEKLLAKNEPVSLITISNHLTRQGDIEKTGGSAYLALLTDTIPVAVHIPHYCDMVKKARQRRDIIAQSNKIIQAAFDESDHEALLEMTLSAFTNVDDGFSKDNVVTFGELALSRPDHWERLKSMDGITGVPTGFTDIDRLTGGLHNSDLIVLGARPAMGKTSLALAIAEGAARNGFPVAVVSLEMPPGQLFDRSTAKASKIDTKRFRRGQFTKNHWKSMVDVMDEFSRLPISMNEKPLKSFSSIVCWVRQRYRETGIKLVVIDYLQLIRGNPGIQRKDLEIAEITRSLKELALELDIPIILLSQLNRNLEQRYEKRPMLSDLRESGAIEQDADVVAFLYREEVYNEDSPEKGIAGLDFAKHRNGPTGMVKLAWIDWRCAFENLVR